MTERPRASILCLPALLLCAANFSASPDVSAKPSGEPGPGRGKALGRLKKSQQNSPPDLSGTPSGSVLENVFYEFVPTASDPDGDPLTFEVVNKPSWAYFDPTTGSLYGTPTTADLGRYDAIQVAVSDGVHDVALEPFSIDVLGTAMGSVTLNWQPPTENTDGSPLIDLTGYRIYCGVDPTRFDDIIDVSNPGLTSYVVDQLTAGTWYFKITALNATGQESSFSNQVAADVL